MKMAFVLSLLSFQGSRSGYFSPSHSRGSGTDLPLALLNFPKGTLFNRASHSEQTEKGQKGKLRNNEHLSNRSSLSQRRHGLHEDMVHTKQESCQ
jgi:hypothetical protein